MGFDFDRSEMDSEPEAGGESLLERMEQLLEQNLMAEQAALDSYRRIAAAGKTEDEATLRLCRMMLAAEEEHAHILSTLRDTLRDMKPGKTSNYGNGA
jgi:bacterioferritin (cytochrome b1)